MVVLGLHVCGQILERAIAFRTNPAGNALQFAFRLELLLLRFGKLLLDVKKRTFCGAQFTFLGLQGLLQLRVFSVAGITPTALTVRAIPALTFLVFFFPVTLSDCVNAATRATVDLGKLDR